jgi:phospholipid/cholesterol/gamma-HCH transport system substrate-binding protein
MAREKNEIRVGVTLLVAAIVLILGILWLGGFKLRDERYEVSVVFPEVGGLAPGDKVTVAGLESGEVISLGLDQGIVLVNIKIEPSIKIPVDSRASVSSYGLIGAKSVAFRPGKSGEYLQPGAKIIGVYEKGLGDVVAEMGEALTEIRHVLHAADEALSDVEGRRQVKETLENANVATVDLRKAVGDLKVTASDLRTFVETNRGGAGSAVDSMQVASARFAQVTADLERISASLDTIVGGLERSEGTLGKLLKDSAAHDEFTAAVREVRDLVAEIKRNPKSFVRFSIF